MTVNIEGVPHKRWRSKFWFIPVQHDPGMNKEARRQARKSRPKDPIKGADAGRRGKH